jgi:hypothetical protein
MDVIFIKTHETTKTSPGAWGAIKRCFDVVRIAREMPYRYDKNGDALINYEETEEHERRKSSVAYVEGPVRSRRGSRASEGEKSGNKV